MTLKGNLEVLNLSDIFQSLSLNKHTGTLVVTDGRREKLIYFAEGEITLFSSDKRLKIGDMLVAAGKIAREDLDYALSQQQEISAGANTQAIKLGEILVEEGFVTQEDVTGIVKEQIAEEIYDLFLWKKADFEFLVDYCPDKLRRPSCDITTLQFNTSSLIMEAARRLDEWEIIQQEIPTLKEVFTLTQGVEEALQSLDLPPRICNETFRIDGYHTVEQIADEGNITRFELCNLLFELKKAGQLRPLKPQELSDRAEELFREGRFRDAAGLYERLAEMLPKNVSIRRMYAETLRAFGNEPAALEQYKFIAGQLEGRRGDRSELARIYRAVLELDPENREVHERLRRLGRTGLGRSLVRILAFVLVLTPIAVLAAAWQLGAIDPLTAVRTWLEARSTDETPRAEAEEASARQLFAEAQQLLEGGRIEEAWNKLRSVLDLYPETAVAEQVRLPLRVETDPPGKQLHVNGILHGRTPFVLRYLPSEQALELEVREGEHVLWRGELDPAVYNEVFADLKRSPAWTVATDGPVRTRPVFYRGAVYFVSLDGKLYGVRLEDQQPAFQAPLREGAADPLGEATSAPVLSGGLLCVSTLDGNALTFDLEGRERAGRARLSEQPVLAGPALLPTGSVVFASYAGEVSIFSPERSRLLKTVPLFANRVLADVVAAGDAVYVASTDNRLLALRIDESQPALQVAVEWQHTAGDDLLVAPAVYESRLLVGDEAGTLVCLERSSGALKWTQEFGVAVAGVAASRGVAVVSTRDGAVRGVDIPSGRVEWRVELESEPGPPAIHQRSACIVTRSGAVHALDYLSGGASIWTARLDVACLAAPVVHDGLLLLGAEDGKLYCFELELR